MSGSVSGIAGLADDVRRWGEAAGARAPVYQELLRMLLSLMDGDGREAVALRDRLEEAWAPRSFRVFYDRPLLLLAALGRESFSRSIRRRFVQTNETSRAIAWLLPAAHVGERPIALFEIGAAAGLASWPITCPGRGRPGMEPR